MKVQSITPVNGLAETDDENHALGIYAGVYCLEGLNEFGARFVDNVFLSISVDGEELLVSNDYDTGAIVFEKFQTVNGIRSAFFSKGYVFELDSNNQPIHVRRGDTCWTFWGK